MSDPFQIQTKRLLLRRLSMQDSTALFYYRALPDVCRFQSWHPEHIEEVEAFLRENEAVVFDAPDTWLQVAVCLSDGRLIGDIGIHTLDHDQLELGYTLSPEYQGQGYASEAVSAILHEAFLVWNKHRVTASVDPDNHASVRLLERLGFRKEAHHVKSYWENGTWVDDCIYAMLQEEYTGTRR